MNRDAQIQAYNEPTYVQASADAGQPQQVNLFKLVHRLLRGRYAITVILAVLLGAAGAVGGYMSSEPKYKTEAMIRIRPKLNKILYETEQSSIPPMFSSFVSTQANLIRQPRIISRAVQSDAWRRLKGAPTPRDEAEFRANLKVTTSRDAPELIFVSFVDVDAKATYAAVDEIIKAYRELEMDEDSGEVRMQTLTDRRSRLESERRDFENRILWESREFETSDLDTLHNYRLQQQLALDERLTELEVLLAQRGVDFANLPADAPLEAREPEPTEQAHDLPPDEISLLDRQMAEYMEQLSQARRAVARLKAAGIAERHSDYIRAASEVIAVEDRIVEYAKQWNERFAGEMPVLPSSQQAIEPTPKLIERYYVMKKAVDRAQARTEEVNKVKVKIDGHRSEIRRLDEKLAETAQRIDALNLESTMEEQVGRIQISPPILPSAPTVDSRKKLAAFGLVAGAGLPVALMLLLGLIDRRLRYSDQADGPALSAPMLGVLPYLPGDGADPNQVAAAVHGVHHIRTLLQLASNKRQHRVYAVTSPTAGDGKTSLSLSLAMSFSAAGSRTALIDFDLIGQGLSSRLKLATEHGIGEALASGHLNGSCSMHTPFPGLTVMGPKPEEIDLVSRLSGDNVAKVIEELRESFDTVIVDTGPILGSLEATMACSSADAVVLVVGRGQHQPNIQSALNKLVQIGANCVGLVFNRAHSADFNRSAGTMSMRSVRTAEIQRTKPASDNPLTKHLDPLTRSMAAEIDRPALP